MFLGLFGFHPKRSTWKWGLEFRLEAESEYFVRRVLPPNRATKHHDLKSAVGGGDGDGVKVDGGDMWRWWR